MWMKIDDRLHSHRKTRKVVRSDAEKARDIAPMGLWVIAGSWASQNGTDGWVPEHELDRWDDDWDDLADRLVKAGYWWPERHEGEPGYGFVDWEDYNPVTEARIKSGAFAAHVRWHVNEGIVSTDCEHCPQEAVDESEIPPEMGEDAGRMRAALGSHVQRTCAPMPLPVPVPQPIPNPKDSCASADAERDFATWWSAYPRKKGKGQAAKAYRAARKKTDATTLLEAVKAQREVLIKEGVNFCPHPATWLNGERWADEADNVVQLDPDRPKRVGLAFVPTCPTCGAPPEDVHDPECPDQSWRPNTEGIGL